MEGIVGQFLKIASAVSGGVVLLLCFILIPSEKWDSVTLFAVLMLASSVVISIWAPSSIIGWGKSEVGTITSIGISSFILIYYVFMSIITLGFGIIGVDRTYVWATGVFTLGSTIVGLLISREAVSYSDVTFPDIQDSEHSFKNIKLKLEELLSTSGPEFKNKLNHISEMLIYAPSDLKGSDLSENKLLKSLIDTDLTIAMNTNNITEFDETIRKIESEIEKRAIYLKGSRTRTQH